MNGAKFKEFPVLIKFIDAKQPLSVQVHPSDEYALRVEGEYGKTEMWVRCGLRAGCFAVLRREPCADKRGIQKAH